MKEAILAYIEPLASLAQNISPERKVILKQISQFIVDRAKENNEAKLTYICTHNSRRSHFGQVWAQVLADYMGLSHVESFSGGTEETACHKNTLKALQSIGFDVSNLSTENNQKISIGSGDREMLAWSKVYDAPENPQNAFCAILTCSEADQGCPYVAGAAKRIACPYQDPKQADGSSEETQAYLNTSMLIATECWYVMSEAKQALKDR